ITTQKLIISIIFYFFAIMTLVCHTVAMFTNPGYVDSKTINSNCNNSKKVETDNSSNIDSKNTELFCKKCNKSRPERSHHCSKCGKCVLKMDHHCPWIFNCVGFYNQKAFYLFLFYATFGDLIACICLG